MREREREMVAAIKMVTTAMGKPAMAMGEVAMAIGTPESSPRYTARGLPRERWLPPREM